MENCEQAPGLNMIQHGEWVHDEYKKLIANLEQGGECKELQDVWTKFGPTLPPPDVLRSYHVYHDCGKHLCLTISDDGRRHFPNHAEISSKQYSIIFPSDVFSAILIARDMDFHVLRGDDLQKILRNPIAPILYLSAWAEINANAQMFGGRDSESYKIKRSRLIQAGKNFLTSKDKS